MKVLTPEQRKAGFRQVSRNGNVMVLEQIISRNVARRRKKKGKTIRPRTINLHMFDREELERYRAIMPQILQNYPVKRKPVFYTILHAIGNFIMS